MIHSQDNSPQETLPRLLDGHLKDSQTPPPSSISFSIENGTYLCFLVFFASKSDGITPHGTLQNCAIITTSSRVCVLGQLATGGRNSFPLTVRAASINHWREDEKEQEEKGYPFICQLYENNDKHKKEQEHTDCPSYQASSIVALAHTCQSVVRRG